MKMLPTTWNVSQHFLQQLMKCAPHRHICGLYGAAAALATAADPPQLGSAQKKKKELFCRDQASLPGCPCFPFSYFNVWGEWQATDGGGQIDVIALDDPLPFPTPFWKLHPRKAIAGDSAVDSAARGPGPLPGLVNAGPARTGGKRLPAPSLPRRPAHRGPSGSCTPAQSRWKPGCRGAPRCQDSPSKHLSGLAESEGCPAERGQRKALGGQKNWNQSSHSAVGRKQPHRAQLWILLEGNRVMDYGPGQAQPSPAQPSQGRAQRQPELWQQRRSPRRVPCLRLRPGDESPTSAHGREEEGAVSPSTFSCVEVAPKEGGERAGDEKAPPGSRRLGQHLLGHHIAFLPCLMAAGCARAGKTIPQKSKLQGKMRSPVLSFEALPDQL
ncbi:PREDICTED: uncharacterized protein LOC102257037 [Myotis brandtii]|uniref:uncharacterized protein LOC102257037 n=1 Tax=Myotis brandtii TaxID=109478 RepID=UPI0007044BB6|nr:PREDICTED: uncharacterized protein LOC102257037 [Myotis brandtii]